MAISILQVKSTPTGGGGNNVVTFDSAVTAGSAIVVFAFDGTASSDSINGSHGTEKGTVNDTTNGFAYRSWVFENSGGGSMTVTCTGATAVVAFEVGGVGTTPYDAHAERYQTNPGTGTD